MSSHRSTTPLRTAVVGTGGIARSSHLPALRTLAEAGEVELVAAVDVDMDAVRAFAVGAGIPYASTDLDATLAERHPDLVVLCTPPAVHRDQAVTALKAGAWVWCEKPPCPSLADFDAIETAEEPGDAGPYASIVFQHRFGSGARQVRRLLREGRSAARSSPTARPPGTGTPPTTPFRGAGGGRPRAAGPPWGMASTRRICSWT